ncbi:MAG: hypothetical protein WA792_02415 [Pseudolabrys sp.]|jgi:hypothetical protein
MKWLLVLAGVLCFAGTAAAEDCTKSRDYILDGLAGDLLSPPARYRDLFQTCLGALKLANVKDAYVLRDGGIGVIAKRDTLTATAQTLADFCERFPKETLRFITRREQRQALTVGRAVMMTSTTATSCKKIRGVT